ncbi:MAG: TonB-dependent receptor [Colwellia sp.]|nr:TonB-dependent receptor [Colwellia sp.]
MLTKSLGRLCCGVALWLCGFSATANNTNYLEMTLQELMVVEVTVASKTPETISQAPSSVTVFTRKQIQNMGINSVEELLNYVPGFYAGRRVESAQGYAVSSRGRGASPISHDILFLLNGQRLNTEWSGGALFYNRYITTANVKQVEVIRGPGSALYGSNAFSGVVNIITDDNLNEVVVSAGNLKQKEAYVNLSKKFDKWSASMLLKAYKDGGATYSNLIDSNVDSTEDPWQGIDFHAEARNDKLSISLRHTSRDLEQFYVFGRFLNNDINEFSHEQSSIALDYKLYDEVDYKLSLYADYMHSKRDTLLEIISRQGMQSLPPGVVTTGTDAFIGGPVAEESDSSIKLDSEWQVNKSHRLFSGFQYRRADIDKVRNQSNYDFDDFINVFILTGPPPAGEFTFLGEVIENSAFGDEGSREINSIYLQDKWQVSSGLGATIGVRYDDYSDFGDTFNTRAALVYTPSKQNTFKVIYGEAFRAPSIREKTITSNPVLVGDVNISPEEITTTELNWMHTGELYFTSMTVFHSNIDDVIVLTPLGGEDPRNTFINQGTLSTSGVEIELTTSITDAISIRGALTHLIDIEDEPQRAPKNTLSYSINYAKNNFNLNLNGFYIDETESEIIAGSGIEIIKYDSYWLNNLVGQYQLNKNLKLEASIYNLSDKKYFTTGTSPSLTTGVPNRGRTYLLSATYSF